MNKVVDLIFVCIIFLLSSCRQAATDQEVLSSMESSDQIITVDNTKKYIQIPYDSLFQKSYNIVPLATDDAHLIGAIDRIALTDSSLFILDKPRNTVYVYTRGGDFVRAISHVGGGPEEYQSLTDFTLDTANNHIILYTDRPKRLMTYTMDDIFVSSKSISPLLENISFDPESKTLIGFNRSPTYKDYFMFYNLLGETAGSFLTIDHDNPIESLFHDYRIEYPFLIRSKGVYCVFPYLNTVFKLEKGYAKKVWTVDFTRVPEEKSFVDIDARGIVMEVIKENLGFLLGNFSETQDFVSFSFGRGTKVVHAKDTEKRVVFDLLYNSEANFYHSNHFAHDDFTSAADDRSYIFKEETFNLVQYYRDMKLNDPKSWQNIDMRIKDLLENKEEEDNPILFFYTLKDTL